MLFAIERRRHLASVASLVAERQVISKARTPHQRIHSMKDYATEYNAIIATMQRYFEGGRCSWQRLRHGMKSLILLDLSSS